MGNNRKADRLAWFEARGIIQLGREPVSLSPDDPSLAFLRCQHHDPRHEHDALTDDLAAGVALFALYRERLTMCNADNPK
jgi:hypothetical protein